MTLRIVVAEDNEKVREMLVSVLAMHDFEIAGEAGDGEEAIDVTRAATPDIVVMDYKMPGVDGLEATRRILAERPEQRVIIYSAYLTSQLIAEALKVGVAVCVPKTAGVEELAREIEAAAADLRT